MATKGKTQARCSNCGHVESKWSGQCPNCKEWGTMEEEAAPATSFAKAGGGNERVAARASGNAPQRISDVSEVNWQRIPSGIGELDRVLGKGFVPGGVTLLAGSPGAGKSSLSNIVAKRMADRGMKVLYVSGEETEAQIADRAKRMNALSENIYLMNETSLDNAIAHARALRPDFLIVDSLQTLMSEDSQGRMGSPTQVTEVANQVTSYAKQNDIPTIIIGQVTKAETVGGPRIVEHLVDQVLYFEANSDSPLRILRGIKNRFGPIEVGVFEHTQDGLEEVADPSGFFLEEHDSEATGYAASILLEGNRALPIEVQALVTPTGLPNPRKVTNGLDHNRSLMVQAILEKHGKVRLGDKDVYVSTSGGLLAKDSSMDLAVAAAIVSSFRGVAWPKSMIFLGETSLTGEVRAPNGIRKRTNEAQRLGFDQIVRPRAGKDEGKFTIVSSIKDLIALMPKG